MGIKLSIVYVSHYPLDKTLIHLPYSLKVHCGTVNEANETHPDEVWKYYRQMDEGNQVLLYGAFIELYFH